MSKLKSLSDFMIPYRRILLYPSLYFLGVIATPYNQKKREEYIELASKLLLNAMKVTEGQFSPVSRNNNSIEDIFDN